MSDIEKSKLIELLIEQRDEARRREEAVGREMAALQNRITELIDQNSRLMKQNSHHMECLMNQICELTGLLREKENENARLQSRLNVANRNRYARTSQKTDSSGKNRNEGGSLQRIRTLRTALTEARLPCYKIWMWTVPPKRQRMPGSRQEKKK